MPIELHRDSLFILTKSCILFSKNMIWEEQLRLAGLFRVNLVANVGSYFGLPTDWGDSKVNLYGLLQEKIGGKEILLKSVAQALPSYVMGVFKLPKKVCKRLVGAFFDF